MKKKYRTIICGCKYSIDNYADNIFCPLHDNFNQISLAIAQDVKQIVLDVVNRKKV